MTVRDRFSDVLDIVKLGASGEVSLDQEYPPLFSALCRFYSDYRGVQFGGIDVEEDYSILIDHLLADHVLEMT